LHRIVKLRLRPPVLPAKAGSTLPAAVASSPSVMLPLMGVTALQRAATVPVTSTVPLAWANAGAAATVVAANRADQTSFFISRSPATARVAV
jgi:hypothetical protein